MLVASGVMLVAFVLVLVVAGGGRVGAPGVVVAVVTMMGHG
jgi:hypothetical protein